MLTLIWRNSSIWRSRQRWWSICSRTG